MMLGRTAHAPSSFPRRSLTHGPPVRLACDMQDHAMTYPARDDWLSG